MGWLTFVEGIVPLWSYQWLCQRPPQNMGYLSTQVFIFLYYRKFSTTPLGPRGLLYSKSLEERLWCPLPACKPEGRQFFVRAKGLFWDNPHNKDRKINSSESRFYFLTSWVISHSYYIAEFLTSKEVLSSK